MPLEAVFFPVDPEADTFDQVELANDALKRGLKLYTNGRQFALFPKPMKGWALFAAKIKPEAPCAA